MNTDPIPNINRTPLIPLSEECLSGYDASVYFKPPIGYQDPNTIYNEIPNPKDIQKKFIDMTPVYPTTSSALLDHQNTQALAENILQAREVNSWKVEDLQHIPSEVKEETQGHWKYLLKSLPDNSRISFLKGHAVVDFPMQTQEGLVNTGTMIIDLGNGSKKDGFKIVNFLQTNQNGDVISSDIFKREDMDVRFKEENWFVRWFRGPGKVTMASAQVIPSGSEIDINVIKSDKDNYLDIPIFFHEFSHTQDGYIQQMTKRQSTLMSLAYINEMLIPISATSTLTTALLGSSNPTMLLLTGGLFTLDRILHHMSKDPNNDVGKGFNIFWKSEVQARISQKIAADILMKNGFVSNTNTFEYILDLYQPETWTTFDMARRLLEEELKKRNPQPQPSPA